jgi:hypothetical protein
MKKAAVCISFQWACGNGFHSTHPHDFFIVLREALKNQRFENCRIVFEALSETYRHTSQTNMPVVGEAGSPTRGSRNLKS